MKRRTAILAAAVALGVAPSLASASLGQHVDCRLLSPTDAPPAGVADCVDLHPGIQLSADYAGSSQYCALGFFFRDARGRLYASTAPQCAAPYLFETEETVWAPSKGPTLLRDRVIVGRFVYRYEKGPVQFALFEVNRLGRPNPQLCVFGGPTGLNADHVADAQQVQFVTPSYLVHGNGLPYLAEGKTAIAPDGFVDKHTVSIAAPSLPNQDGSPAISTDGRALGVTRWWYPDADTQDLTTIAPTTLVVRLSLPLQRAQRALRTRLTLVTAPTL